ncbi:MAG: serine hydrolase, partial [Gammaproteobacteria bacterium]
SATVFEIGSVTKIFTSLALAYESYLGQVDLDDPVILYLRNAPTSNRAFDQITLAGLASHVSGLGQMPASTIHNRYQLMQSLNRWRPPYKVNTWWKYSNIGFGMLGYTLEDITHQSYITMLKKQILIPLKMSDTGLVGSPCFSCAQGYSWNGQPVTTTKTLLVIPAAGSIRSSGRDMLKFLGAAVGAPGVPTDVAEAMRITQMPYYQTPYGAQGLGWEIHNFNKLYSNGYVQAQYRTLTIHSSPAYQVTPEPLRGMILFDKTGSVAGFRAYIAAVPGAETGIVILANSAMPRTQVVLSARQVLYQLVRA